MSFLEGICETNSNKSHQIAIIFSKTGPFWTKRHAGFVVGSMEPSRSWRASWWNWDARCVGSTQILAVKWPPGDKKVTTWITWIGDFYGLSFCFFCLFQVDRLDEDAWMFKKLPFWASTRVTGWIRFDATQGMANVRLMPTVGGDWMAQEGSTVIRARKKAIGLLVGQWTTSLSIGNITSGEGGISVFEAPSINLITISWQLVQSLLFCGYRRSP